MLPNTGYIANTGTLLSFTLPTTSPVGSQMAIYGYGAGAWGILQNASQQVIYGVASSTVGVSGGVGTLNQYDQIILTCVVADTVWVASSPMGSLVVY
jgi:hypothetical protein